MMEDKLAPDERCRLEALAQAIAYNASKISEQNADQIIHTAKRFDSWIWEGNVNDSS